jgi:hypothetical protein
MEEVERPQNRPIGFQEFPQKALAGIDQHHRIEAVAQEPWVPPVDENEGHGEEGGHGE